MQAMTASDTEVCNNFSEIATEVNRTNREVIVVRHSAPWVKICPVDLGENSTASEKAMGAIIERGRADYESGLYVAGVDAARAEIEKLVAVNA